MSERKAKKREVILNSAFALFLEKGYTNTKIIDIANGAGIGKGTVYEYFESKESILLELISSKVKQDYWKFHDVIKQDLPCRDKLTAYLSFQIEMGAKYKMNVTDFKQQFMSGIREFPMEIMDAIHGIIFFQFECVLRIITEGIQKGEFREVDPYVAASCVIGSIGLYLTMLYEDPPCLDRKQFQQQNYLNKENFILDFLFNGLLA